MNDIFLLQRFVDAQSSTYENIVRELTQGQKRTCWMWFVFPQVIGLGHTYTAKKYAIKSIEEAEAYISHPTLGKRLQECTHIILKTANRSAEQIFGYPDNLKFKSSMTLFKQVSNDKKIFADSIAKFYDGKEDKMTIKILKQWQEQYRG